VIKIVKIFHVEEMDRSYFKDGGGFMWNISEKADTKDVGVVLVVRYPKSSGSYHFHGPKNEKIWFVLSGIATVYAEGREYTMKPNTAMYFAPGEKHKLMNKEETKLRVLEIYSHPKEREYVEVLEEDPHKEKYPY